MHYICTGECKGVSDNPGVCQAEDCEREGQPLIECSCTDGNHGGMASPDDISPEESSSEGSGTPADKEQKGSFSAKKGFMPKVFQRKAG